MQVTSIRGSLASVRSNRPPAVPPSFDYTPLNRVLFGAGTLARLGEVARELDGTRVLLVTDPGLEEAGHPQRAAEYLKSSGLEVFVFDEVRENPTTGQVEGGAAFARERNIDLIVAVGGGSSMDCAKGLNFLVTNGGRIADYRGFGKATKPMLPSIGVPTTAGTGSEAQSYALITDERTHQKMACGDKKAAFHVAILDPELTISQPKAVTAVTGIDALSHAIESYVCTKRNPVSQAFSLAAWRHLEPNFEIVLDNPTNLDARAAMQVGSHLAGSAIETAMLGICHSCANPLSHVIRFNAAAVEPLYADLAGHAKLPNGAPASEILARRVADLVELAGLPTRLRDCDVSDTILPLLALEANDQWTARFNPRPVGETELQEVYERAW
jgi:alcohol dehydrogenase